MITKKRKMSYNKNTINSSEIDKTIELLEEMKIKNYTTKTNENEISTHEETFSFTRASLRSVEKHRLKGNLFLINQTSFLEDTNFPNSTSLNFFQSLISRAYAQIPSFVRERGATKYGG